ncbi:RGS5 protein, partial [Polypterus senegalus]
MNSGYREVISSRLAGNDVSGWFGSDVTERQGHRLNCRETRGERIRAKEIKIKLGTLLQKPEHAIDLIIPYPEKPEKKPEKLQKLGSHDKTVTDVEAQCIESAIFVAALEGFSGSDYVISHQSFGFKDGLNAFRSFLMSEFSEENIEFWMACEEYKKIKSPIKMETKAKKIYEEFIQTEAPKEVNIDHFTKDVTIQNLVEPTPTTFDLAQKRIFALMEKDSFARFLRSELYQELLK